MQGCAVEYTFLVSNFSDILLPSPLVLAQPFNERAFLPVKQLLPICHLLIERCNLMLKLLDVASCLRFQILALQFCLMGYIIHLTLQSR